MFPNCTAEYLDKKPSLPCREDCLKVVDECMWSEGHDFLPFPLTCGQYPSKTDPYRSCSSLEVMAPYMGRVAAAPRPFSADLAPLLATTLLVMYEAYQPRP